MRTEKGKKSIDWRIKTQYIYKILQFERIKMGICSEKGINVQLDRYLFDLIKPAMYNWQKC